MRPAQVILGAVGAFIVLAVAAYTLEAIALWTTRDSITYDMRPEPPGTWRRVGAPGVQTPPVIAAEAAGLDDSAAVIGIVAGGVARAYRLADFLDPRHHIVNDVLGGVPVSVAFCDRTSCVRTYTGPGGQALQFAVAGLRDGGLVVRLGGVCYDHQTGQVVEGPPDTPALPADPVPWVRTTWGRWRREHPSTDLSLGSAAAATPSPPVESDRPAR